MPTAEELTALAEVLRGLIAQPDEAVHQALPGKTQYALALLLLRDHCDVLATKLGTEGITRVAAVRIEGGAVDPDNLL
jgi:hypothetical protein